MERIGNNLKFKGRDMIPVIGEILYLSRYAQNKEKKDSRLNGSEITKLLLYSTYQALSTIGLATGSYVAIKEGLASLLIN